MQHIHPECNSFTTHTPLWDLSYSTNNKFKYCVNNTTPVKNTSSSNHSTLPYGAPDRIYLGGITLSKQFGWKLATACRSLSVCSHTEVIKRFAQRRATFSAALRMRHLTAAWVGTTTSSRLQHFLHSNGRQALTHTYSSLNPLKPRGNYMSHLLRLSLTLQFVFVGFVWL
jgi:hypothetical protein